MRTRNAEAAANTKPTPVKKTPPARKIVAKNQPKTPDSAANSETPSTTETKRASAVKAKQVKTVETTPRADTGSDCKPDPSTVKDAKTPADVAQKTPETKAATAAKSAGKKTPGKTKTPVSAKAGAKKIPRGNETAKVTVEGSPMEVDNDKDAGRDTEELAKENVEGCKKEETALTVERCKDEIIEESPKEQIPGENVGNSVNLGKNAGGEVAESSREETAAKNEETKTEVQVEAKHDEEFDNSADGGAPSVVKDEEVKDESVGMKDGDEMKKDSDGLEDGEETKNELTEGTKVVDRKEDLRVDENPSEAFQGDDFHKNEESGGEEGLDEYDEKVDLEEHREEELEQDDTEDSDEETEALEEERKELEAVAKERKKKKECEIFVGGLNREVTEDDLRKVFEKIGEVVEVRLLKDPSTKKNKGYAFVKFAEKEQAKRALEEMKNPIIGGKRCGTAPSEDNDTLFLGNICNTWTKEAVKQKLKDYGIEGLQRITLVSDVRREGLSRGFAFLEFSCHAEAMLAYKRLQKPDVVFGHPERTAKVAFAEPLREPDPDVMAQVKSVFVDGLPPHWDEDRVREKLKDFGEITRIVLARNMSTARRKDFGFVDFSTHEAAMACIDALNSRGVTDGKSKVKVKSRLSNPLPKIQAVKGGMSGGYRIGRTGSGTAPKTGRGYGRAIHPRVNLQRGKGFSYGGRGNIGRVGPMPHKDYNYPYAQYHGRQVFGRGGRRGSARGSNASSSIPASSSARPGYGADGGRGRRIPPRRQTYSPEGHFERPLGRNFDDPYLYEDTAHGLKRPLYMVEHDPDFVEPSRIRPRLDYSDPAVPIHGSRYRDNFAAGGSGYSHDYYGSDQYAGAPYPSYYGADRAYGRGNYY